MLAPHAAPPLEPRHSQTRPRAVGTLDSQPGNHPVPPVRVLADALRHQSIHELAPPDPKIQSGYGKKHRDDAEVVPEFGTVTYQSLVKLWSRTSQCFSCPMQEDSELYVFILHRRSVSDMRQTQCRHRKNLILAISVAERRLSGPKGNRQLSPFVAYSTKQDCDQRLAEVLASFTASGPHSPFPRFRSPPFRFTLSSHPGGCRANVVHLRGIIGILRHLGPNPLGHPKEEG